MPLQRQFLISYFSEVSALVEVTETDEYIEMYADHPSENVDLKPNWFHFSNVGTPEEVWDEDKLDGDVTVRARVTTTKKEALMEALDKLADELWPGPKLMMQEHPPDGIHSETEMEAHFRQVLLYAFITGKHTPANGYHELRRDHWIEEWENHERQG